MLQAKKNLFLITSCFPSDGEPFLVEEIKQHQTNFDKIVIISHDTQSKITETMPSNSELYRISYTPSFIQKALSILLIFHPLFWKELLIVKNIYQKKITLGIIKTMLISLQNAKRLAKIYAKICKKFPSEKSYFYSYWSDDSALAIALLKEKQKEIKSISRVHRWDVYFEENQLNYLPFRHFISQHLDVLLAISNHAIQYIKNTWKVSINNVFLAKLGVNNLLNAKRNTTEFVLLSCSNIIPVKRVHLIAEALLLIKNFPIKWVHFGAGKDLPAVKKITENVSSNVTVEFKGHVLNDVVFSYLSEQTPDLFINVSSSEGVPVSIMEAYSFGIPAIATDVGGVNELVNHENGYLLAKNTSAQEIADTLSQFYHLSEVDKQTKQKKAYEKWQSEYNAEKNFQELTKKLSSM